MHKCLVGQGVSDRKQSDTNIYITTYQSISHNAIHIIKAIFFKKPSND